MTVYSGTFVTCSGVTVGGTSDAPVLTVTFDVDDSLVNTASLDPGSASYGLFRIISDDDSEYVPLPSPDYTWDGSTIRAVFNLSDALTPGKYQFEFAVDYNDWEGFTRETFNIG